MEFNDDLHSVSKTHKSKHVNRFIDDFVGYYEFLINEFPSTYSFTKLDGEPTNVDTQIEFISCWIGGMICSMNCRVIEIII